MIEKQLGSNMSQDQLVDTESFTRYAEERKQGFIKYSKPSICSYENALGGDGSARSFVYFHLHAHYISQAHDSLCFSVS